jgi:steroid 5-alpha reductase family enzyme
LLVAAWGGRLTWNCFRRWESIRHEDWRYRAFRGTSGRAYWLVSFAGIHLMPTLVVFAACLPLIPALMRPAQPLGWLDMVAAGVTFGAVGIEAVADSQLRRFLRSPRPERSLLESGLWALCRHPNYAGEILFWWGLYLFGLSAAPSMWWAIVGPIAMTALFLGISIPMIDRHMLQRYPAYQGRMRRSFALLPWPKG